jgi:hypothetical protein
LRRFALLLAALALAGCGGDGGDGSSPPAKNPKPNSNQNPDAQIGAP